jgi:hyperosmotically inducible protein
MKLLITIVLLTGLTFAQTQSNSQLSQRPGNPAVPQERIKREVRHELAMLPYFTIFDNLEYKVEGNTVTLLGQVTNPELKDDAGRVVKKVEGVEEVKNNIDVLPLSPDDDRIRRQVARSIFATDGLLKYSMSALPPLHIIVKNGHVTLKGVVDNSMDKQLAYNAANGVPGVFSVDNDLQVPGSTAASNK